MITAGDERGRTQGGNNNAYCQDNEVSWMDWSEDAAWLDVLEVTKAALALRKAHAALRQRHHFVGSPTIEGGPKDVAWMGPDGKEMSDGDWYDGDRAVVGMFVSGDPLRSPGRHGEQLRDRSFLLWVNAGESTCPVQLPVNEWVATGEVVLSTDPAHAVGAQVTSGTVLPLAPRSLVLLRKT
jgi:glycogen operon protein